MVCNANNALTLARNRRGCGSGRWSAGRSCEAAITTALAALEAVFAADLANSAA